MINMKRIDLMGGIFVVLIATTWTHGHGIPITVTSSGGSLVVSGEVSSGDGYAPVVIVQDDPDGDPSPPLNISPLGNVFVWQVPAFDISGLSTTSSLSLDVIARPLNTSSPVPSQALWYWNPATNRVASSSAPFYLLGTGQRIETLTPTESTSPASFLVADPVGGDSAAGGQQFPDNHDLLAFALDNNGSSPPGGAYGFFARLESDEYGASNSFLVVFNFGVDDNLITDAALAIDRAAFLPGDYNHDDRVDAEDYILWRKTYGSTTALAADGSGNGMVDQSDFTVWRQHFGATVGASGRSVASVPEPASGWLFLAVVYIYLAGTMRERARSG